MNRPMNLRRRAAWSVAVIALAAAPLGFAAPSALERGRYGAIRFAVLTEAGMDSDYAPQTRSGELRTTRWIPRG
jgi:hypothetical protein